nr:helix-turn-helix domain-containing protein [uncultured Pseudokineococcus sp.]
MSAGHTAVTDQVSDPGATEAVEDELVALEPCGLPEHPDCGIRDVLDRLGDTWSVLAVVELSSGTRRSSELKRALHGVSQRMLTLTLRRLERDGLVLRTVYPTVPATVTYELTDRGRSLTPLVQQLADWSLRHRAAIAESRREYDRATTASDRA